MVDPDEVKSDAWSPATLKTFRLMLIPLALCFLYLLGASFAGEDLTYANSMGRMMLDIEIFQADEPKEVRGARQEKIREAGRVAAAKLAEMQKEASAKLLAIMPTTTTTTHTTTTSTTLSATTTTLTVTGTTTTTPPLLARSQGVALGSKTHPLWIHCAAQWEDCSCAGSVRWGNAGKWLIMHLKDGAETQTVKCSTRHLPDVRPGDGDKHCECQLDPRSEVFRTVNPMLLPKDVAPRTGARVVASCDHYQARMSVGAWGRMQWAAVEALCSPNWTPKEDEMEDAKAGPRALDAGTIRRLMRAWVDGRFVENYQNSYDSQGWVKYAFVVLYAGSPESNEAAMCTQLIESVHLFSEYPIVVVNMGMATPSYWQPDHYPRLVLLHAAPMPAHAQRTKHLDELRMVLLAQVHVGILMHVSQFVAPGVDNLFRRTEEEINRKYRLPILPVHFMEKNPRDGAPWWARFCPGTERCQGRTMRWANAHPTWTFWALTFFGRWLRRNLRDETLEPRATPPSTIAASLRVVDLRWAEDLLNVAIWEDSGRKQWCKFDLPDPSDFDALLDSPAESPYYNCTSGRCSHIGADPLFYPEGVPKVFYIGSHAISPNTTALYLARLAERRRAMTLPPPILYKERFFRDEWALKEAHPEVSCLI